MSTLAIVALSLAHTLAAATIGALITRGWWDWKAWRARRDLTMALATRARAAEVMAEAKQVRKVYDDLPDVDPRKCWGAEIHEMWEVLRQERDDARRETEEARVRSETFYWYAVNAAAERDDALALASRIQAERAA